MQLASQTSPLRIVPQPSNQPIDLHALTNIEPCIRVLYIQHLGSFTDYVSVCMAHHWISNTHGDESTPQQEVCQVAVQQRIAQLRARELLRGRFRIVQAEVSHGA